MRAGKAGSTVIAAIFVLAACAAACGDDAAGDAGGDGGSGPLVCGPGTVLEGDLCVPAVDLSCGGGTVLDPERGECVLSGEVCAPGSVLVGDHCEERGGIVADLEEAAEPNDTIGRAGEIPLPGEGAGGVVLHGCIDPYALGAPFDQDGAQLLPDIDSWTIRVGEPTLLDITSDGVGGLAAGFLILPDDAALQRDGWSRWAFNLVGDLSRRQVFLPRAGDYEISLWDSRALVARLYTVVPLGAGGREACYYTTVRRIPLPEAIDLPVGAPVEATLEAGPRLYRFAPVDGEVLDVQSATPAATFHSSVGATLLVDDLYVSSSNDLLGTARLVSAFASGEEALVVIDPVYDYSPTGAPSFQMTAQRFESQPLLLGQQTMTLVNPGATRPSGPGDYHILRFDVPAGDIVFTDLDFSAPTHVDILDRRAFYAADGTAGVPTTSLRSSIRYAEAGRHYLFLFTPGAEPGSLLDVTAQMTPFGPPPLALDAPIGGAPLGPRAEAWYTIDLTDELWLQFEGAGRNFGGDDLQVELYDPNDHGTVYSGLYPSFSFPLPAGSARGRFFPQPDTRRPWLLRLSDPFPPPLDSASFDLQVSRRPYTDLGSLAPGGAIRAADQTLEAGGAARYFLRGDPGQRVTVTVTPAGFDALLRNLGGDEFGSDIDEGGTGEPERFVADLYDTSLWIAFDVQGDATGAFAVDITSEPFATYRTAASGVRFADVCGAGEDVPLLPGLFGGDPTDEGLSALIPMPFAFTLFGDRVSDLVVGSNGWLSGEGRPLDTTNPDNGPLPQFDNVNGAIVPYWDDLQGVRVCMLAQEELLVLQWSGWLASSPTRLVQFQARLHAGGAIDFVYGPLHMADGASATVGVENLAVDAAAQVVFDERGRIRPDTSITLSPE